MLPIMHVIIIIVVALGVYKVQSHFKSPKTGHCLDYLSKFMQLYFNFFVDCTALWMPVQATPHVVLAI